MLLSSPVKSLFAAVAWLVNVVVGWSLPLLLGRVVAIGSCYCCCAMRKSGRRRVAAVAIGSCCHCCAMRKSGRRRVHGGWFDL